jgi:hypothetical protein
VGLSIYRDTFNGPFGVVWGGVSRVVWCGVVPCGMSSTFSCCCCCCCCCCYCSYASARVVLPSKQGRAHCPGAVLICRGIVVLVCCALLLLSLSLCVGSNPPPEPHHTTPHNTTVQQVRVDHQGQCLHFGEAGLEGDASMRHQLQVRTGVSEESGVSQSGAPWMGGWMEGWRDGWMDGRLCCRQNRNLLGGRQRQGQDFVAGRQGRHPSN